jgi:hypothetical protein
MAAIDVRDCGTHLSMDGTAAACPGIMLHCVTLVQAGSITSEPEVVIVFLQHRLRAIYAESIAQETSSPPPRV